MDALNRMVGERPVVIFSKTTCCMSHTIVSLITGFGSNPAVYEIDKIPNGKQIEKALVQLGCQPSVPAVFVAKRLVGGERQVMSLHVQGRLVPMLMEAGALWL